MGRAGPGRGRGVPRLLPRPPRPQPPGRVRGDAAGGLPRLRARQLHLGRRPRRRGCGRRSTRGSGTSTGPTPTCSSSTPTSSARWPTSASRCCGWTRSRSSGSGSGPTCQNQPEVHAITQVLRTVARMAAPALAFKAEAIVGPRDLVQYLGQGRHAGRVSDLAYHNSLMVQVWSMLATGDTVLARHALASLPTAPVTGTWITYVRCHDDIGWAIDDRDAAAVGLNGHDHRRFLADWYAGEHPGLAGRTAWCSSTTRPPATSGSAAPPPRWSASTTTTRTARPGPAVPGARDRRRLGRGARDLERRRARPAQRPRLGRRARARGRQPVGAPAAARLGPRRRARRPAHRARQGVRRARPPGPGPGRAAAAARVRPEPGAHRHRPGRPGHRPPAPERPDGGPLQRDEQAPAVPDRPAARGRPRRRRTTRWAGTPSPPGPTAWSGCRRTPRGGWWTARRIATG